MQEYNKCKFHRLRKLHITESETQNKNKPVISLTLLNKEKVFCMQMYTQICFLTERRDNRQIQIAASRYILRC